MNEREAIAAIRIVGAVARADGKITDDERSAFRQAVAEFDPKLPDGTSVEDLLSQDIELDAELAAVNAPVLKKAVFETALAMSLVDGAASSEENEVLKRIRTAFAYDKETSVLDRVLHDPDVVATVMPVLGPAERAERVRDLIARRALWAGIFGAIPIPLVSDIGVLIQIDLAIEGVALLWAHPLTRKERIARFGVIISLAMAQSAVHSLLKLIPGWGSAAGAVGGALSAYVVTHSVGSVIDYHFEKEGKTTAAELKKVFAERKVAAKESYEAQKATIERVKNTHATEIAELTSKLDKKEITVEQFDAKMDELMKK